MKSALLTPQVVDVAVKLIRAGVEEEFIKKQKGRMVACIVVLDPTVDYSQSYELPVLWEGMIGESDPSKWPNPYDRFAREKARLSWMTGEMTHIIQRDRPYLFEHGNFKFGGSFVHEKIIVATSGLLWYHDLAVSGMIATAIKGLTIGAFEVELARKPYFIGAPDPIQKS